MKSPLRDLIRQVQEVASTHFAYSQAADVINNAVDHLSARARIEELNAAENKPVTTEAT